MFENLQGNATTRIKRLREYYLNNSPMAVNRNLLCWKCHRSMMLYVEGWQSAVDIAPTVRIRRSMAEAYMLENLKPVIVPDELIAGQQYYDPFSPEEEKRYQKCIELRKSMPIERGRRDHLALDYTLLLDVGINGIIEILNNKLNKINPIDGSQTEEYEFYLCCKIEFEALLKLCNKYCDYARELADNSHGESKKEYLDLYNTLKAVPAGPAHTFKEALQSIHMFTWSLYGIYSFGKPDVYLLPYYRRDIENGILTPQKAQELIDCFFLQTIPNMSAWAAESLMLGGRDENGIPVENELTWHFLIAIEHTHIPDPNIGFCVTKDTGSDILNYAAKLIADGHCQPQIWNSDEITASMIKNGYDSKAANMFTISTCTEITPIGCSGVSITSPYINLLKIFLSSFEKCDDRSDFEDIFGTFQNDFRLYCNKVIMQENLWQLERGRNSTDPMRISVLIHDCLKRGKSNDSGGAKYNFLEPNILGMQNVTESFNVLQRLVFEEKLLTISEFKSALESNYENHENLLMTIRNKTVHFGTGDSKSNKIAKRIADMIIDTFEPMTTVRGASIIPGAFSYKDHEIHGQSTPASPDGRKSGMPLNDGSCPVQGYDNKGPTMSLISTTSWDPARFLGGTSVNVKINKGVTPEVITSLIKGYMKLHGSQLQFNIVDTKTLTDAQKNPQNHKDLLVRIGGYSDFFVKLPESLQNEIISRSTNNL